MKFKRALKKAPIFSFGEGKIEIYSIKNLVNESHKRSYLEFDIKFIFNDQLPNNTEINYHLTDHIGNDVSSIYNDSNFDGKKFQDLKGECQDHILLLIPEDVKDGSYDITSFINPIKGFEFDGTGLKMKIGTVQIKGIENDISKIYANYKNSNNINFYKSYCKMMANSVYNPSVGTYFDFA